MYLTSEEQDLLAGLHGPAARKAMQILLALGAIYGARRLIPVASVQIAGVSFDNLGEAGLQFLSEMAAGGGKVRVFSTLNPAGMDVENWQALGISPDFAASQRRVIDAFARMGVTTTCTCTPYLVGNLPAFGDHLAWAESSAVCYANSVLGARTNREGGPSALAAALTGRTPEYGFHLEEARRPGVTVEVQARLQDTSDFGALGKATGDKLESAGAKGPSKPVTYLRGVRSASLEQLKSLCASLATYGGAALFHIEGLTPEADQYSPPGEQITITQADLDAAFASLNDASPSEVDFVSLGCPHLSIDEIARLAQLLEGRRVTKEFWITTARPTRQLADRLGYTEVIAASGARFAADTCCVVAPIQGRFTAMATDSAKACYYAYSKNKFKTRLLPFEAVVEEACRPAAPIASNPSPPKRQEASISPAPLSLVSSSPLPLSPIPLSPPSSSPHSTRTIAGRSISPGRASGLTLVTTMGISFFGGVDPETGRVVERGHELEGQSIAGRVLVFPTGKGSTVGSYTLYRLKAAGLAPAAILNSECETITAVGCIISGVPCIDHLPLHQLATGLQVIVDGDQGRIEISNSPLRNGEV